MRTLLAVLLICVSVTLLLSPCNAASPTVLTSSDYEDRVHAAWLGQIIGVLTTLPYEHKVASVLPVKEFPKPYTSSIVDDDWYYEIVALRGFESHGPHLTIDQLGALWLKHNCGTWGSSKYSLAAMKRGVKARDAGHPVHNRLWWTIGPMFSCELYGILTPGNPNLAAKLTRDLGRINGHAEGLDGGVFSAGLVSVAFRETDSKLVVRQAARLIHPTSPFRQSVDLAIQLAENGKSFREVCNAIEDRWHIEYPATNNAVANGGILAACVWFAGGNFDESLNLAASAGDYIDADNIAATACAVVGAMRGTKALPANLVAQLNDRIVGKDMAGLMTLTPDVDESIAGLAKRTAIVGQTVLATNGATVAGDKITVPWQEPTPPANAERFVLADLMAAWNNDWTLERAGFGGGDGGLRGIRGGTFLDGTILATYPRDEVRGLVLRRVIRANSDLVLNLNVGVDPGRAWQLQVYFDNTIAIDRVIEAPAEANGIQWQLVTTDLSANQGREVQIRLYQRVLLPGKTAGNAYWGSIQLTAP